jgi:hypothetical protein
LHNTIYDYTGIDKYPEMYRFLGRSMVWLKIVICEVPTKAEQYADYKLIALFDHGLAYLEGSSEEWIFLSCSHLNAGVEISDAIEHGGIIFAVDATDGSTNCWDPTTPDGIFSIHTF